MNRITQKLNLFVFITLIFLFSTAFSSLDYTRKTEPLPNMPQGNPDSNLGIVVRAHSTGIDVVADSSQNIRFVASKNRDETNIEILRSSSMVDRTPKKFTFIDGQYSFSSDEIYEFSAMFNNKNHQWQSFRFMPIRSPGEWAPKETLMVYLDKWVKIFDDAGWQRIEFTESSEPQRIENFILPTANYRGYRTYCAWKTKEYKADINVALRNPSFYTQYVPKKQRKNIKEIPNGYVVFIDFTKLP